MTTRCLIPTKGYYSKALATGGSVTAENEISTNAAIFTGSLPKLLSQIDITIVACQLPFPFITFRVRISYRVEPDNLLFISNFT